MVRLILNLNEGSYRIISCLEDKKRQHRYYTKFHFPLRKSNICHFVLLLSSLCFKDFIIQMLVHTSDKPLQLESQIY